MGKRMNDFVIATQAWSQRYVHLDGIVDNHRVHVHVTAGRYHLYEGTIVGDMLKTIIEYYQLELKGIVTVRGVKT